MKNRQRQYNRPEVGSQALMYTLGNPITYLCHKRATCLSPACWSTLSSLQLPLQAGGMPIPCLLVHPVTSSPLQAGDMLNHRLPVAEAGRPRQHLETVRCEGTVICKDRASYSICSLKPPPLTACPVHMMLAGRACTRCPHSLPSLLPAGPVPAPPC